MSSGSVQHDDIAPIAHSSSNQLGSHYSLLPATKSTSSLSQSNMALNFSHDLILQAGHHHNHVQSHNQDSQSSASADIKPQTIVGTFPELDSGNLMQSAAVGMNMWNNTMNLNHFKHPQIGEHNFVTNPDINTFSSWTHGSIAHQAATQSMTQHILDGQHLTLSYQHHQHHNSHHQRNPLPLSSHDIVGATLKSQANAGQASFMLNSINHQASTSQNHSHLIHHTATAASAHNPYETANLRHSHQGIDQHLGNNGTSSSGSTNGTNIVDNMASSCILNLNHDNNLYIRGDHRAHSSSSGPVKHSTTALLSERASQMSLATHHHHASQLSYLNNSDQHANHLQPTTSNHMASSNTRSLSSKSVGPFRCPHCSEMFSMRNLYQSHLKTHSQEKGFKAKFKCELCGHSFSQKTSLNRHMKSHTGERPFPCEICGKAFSEKERLKIHMRTHTGEKPFSCDICGKSFSQKSTVKRHQTVHTGEKKFKCDCGKGFANRGNLIAHIKTRGSNHFE